ncbi:glycosyltransferase [Cohnella lupini]|uniref:Glycosyltransferase involved in cell wall biosynthesis n=1 Tax=Cohnella lupini TaxID=1294267 RepID=A0A3D9ITI4_9BACL|nr:glycosyltransferase [Cohnella lupini]RED65070.1 glycosyltransferase involved in cell wall biosynthesis [Cohnella lupini]
MKNILLYDLSNDGHHYVYNSTVMNQIKNQYDRACYYTATDDEKIIEGLQENKIEVLNIKIKRKPNRYLSVGRRTILLLRMLMFARIRGFKRVHLFHLDSNIVSLIFLAPLLLGIQLTGTLHWSPTRKWKRRFLLLLLKSSLVNKMVVHGDYTQRKFIELLGTGDENKIVNIHFPNFPASVRRDEVGLKHIEARLAGYVRPYLLCFGGLRHDKGIDFLLGAMSSLRDREFTLIVAGSEGDFKEEDIRRLSGKYGIRDKLFADLRFIPDDAMEYYFDLCDAVVLPYRKLFSGQSGPLTEGAARNKYILGPGHGEIGHTIRTYELGETFESENEQDLTDKLAITIEKVNSVRKGRSVEPRPATENANAYAPLINIDRFVKRYAQFFSGG